MSHADIDKTDLQMTEPVTETEPDSVTETLVMQIGESIQSEEIEDIVMTIETEQMPEIQTTEQVIEVKPETVTEELGMKIEETTEPVEVTSELLKTGIELMPQTQKTEQIIMITPETSTEEMVIQQQHKGFSTRDIDGSGHCIY